MAGFNSPNIMFLNTYDSLDRRYVRELAPKLIGEGFTRYVELYCGSFVMPLVMADAGWKPEQMHCYDVSLMSNVLGYTFSGRDVEELGVCKWEQPIPLTSADPVENAATILYEQALARMEKAVGIEYFRMIVEDMTYRRKEHIRSIADNVRRMDGILHGLHFEPLYLWDAFDIEKDKPDTFICSNPPTYKGAYEKFFDTDGSITWNEIPYEIWDGSVHCKELAEKAEGQRSLLLFLQQADKGNAATDDPVSARFLSESQNVYWNTNHPEVINRLLGKKVETQRPIATAKSKYPILPDDYEVTKKSQITVFAEDTKVAEYYRGMWLHRIQGKSVTANLCVLIDGMIAGFIGLDLNAIIKPYAVFDTVPIILSYAVPAPNNQQRLARLLVEIAKSKRIVGNALAATQSSAYIAAADSICTVEYSRYKEVKGLRGLMKLKSSETKNGVNALKYYADLTDKTLKQVKSEFIQKEQAYKEKKCRTNG